MSFPNNRPSLQNEMERDISLLIAYLFKNKLGK